MLNMYMHVQRYIYEYVQIHQKTYIQSKYIQQCTHTYTHLHRDYTCINTHIHTNIQTQIYI